jgi:hypothetical protein
MSRIASGSKWKVALSAAVLAAALGARAEAEDVPSEPEIDCPAPAVAPSTAPEAAAPLGALRRTLLLLASDYEKRAQEYASEAERDRTWASAEDMFSEPYGKRYAAVYFADEAHALEMAAEQSRRLAAKYRALANSPKAARGC